jgi:hypothetical protein
MQGLAAITGVLRANSPRALAPRWTPLSTPIRYTLRRSFQRAEGAHSIQVSRPVHLWWTGLKCRRGRHRIRHDNSRLGSGATILEGRRSFGLESSVRSLSFDFQAWWMSETDKPRCVAGRLHTKNPVRFSAGQGSLLHAPDRKQTCRLI